MSNDDHKIMQIRHQVKNRALKTKQEMLNVKQNTQAEVLRQLKVVQQPKTSRTLICEEGELVKIDNAQPVKNFFKIREK